MRQRLTLLMCLVLLLGLTACAIDKGAGGDKNEGGAKASEEMADQEEYYKLSEDLFLLVINGVVNEDRSIRSDGQIYIPYSVVKSLDSRFYYNRSEEQMIITTPNTILYYWPNNMNHREGDENKADRTAMFRTFEGKLYLSTEVFVKYSDVSTRILYEPRRVVLFKNGVKFPSMTANKDTAVRIGASLQKDIVVNLQAGDSVIMTGNSENGYYSVSTEDGQTGYVAMSDLSSESEMMIHASIKDYPRTSTISHVHLMWHQIWAPQGGEELRAALLNTKGINVIAPTWFDFKDVTGEITTLANASYVEEAHRQGIQVWALCSDFAADVKGYDILSNTEHRNNLERNLVNEVVRVGADGINLDFEFITKDSGPHYIQFIRELYLLCRENNLVLSVDNFVPNAGKAHYQRADQADVLDYLIFMAHDEHYKGSGAGSVASYPWVEMSVKNALAIVPKEKIVLGVPLFNRVWMTDKDGNLTIENGGMTTIMEQAKAGAELQWDDELKQYYAEYVKKDVKYQYWIEDVTSLEYKLKLISNYGLAGYAGWKLGLEAADAWSLLDKY